MSQEVIGDPDEIDYCNDLRATLRGLGMMTEDSIEINNIVEELTLYHGIDEHVLKGEIGRDLYD